MWVGSRGSDLQMETQLIILQTNERNSYAVIIPLIEGNFRSAIQPGNDRGEVILCVESGSTKVKAKNFSACAYLHVGHNPYDIYPEGCVCSSSCSLGNFQAFGRENVAKNY